MTEPLVAFPLTDEQRALQRLARELADTVFRERAARWDEREEYPWDNVKEQTAHGLMGLTIPREYGGRGLPALDAILVIEAVARACGVTGRILVDSNFGRSGSSSTTAPRPRSGSTSRWSSRATSRRSRSRSRRPGPRRRTSRRRWPMATRGCWTSAGSSGGRSGRSRSSGG